MSKFIKCWVFIICLLFIFLILFTDRVKAETCDIQHISNMDNLLSLTDTLSNGVNRFEKPFYNNNYLSFGNHTYIKGQIWFAFQKTNGTYTSNIDYDLTCSTSIQGDHGETATITYADGTQATINYNEYIAICTQWTQNNAYEVGTIEYEPYITNIGLQIKDNNDIQHPCDVDMNGNFICEVSNNLQYKTMRFMFTLSKYSSTNLKYGIISSSLRLCNSDTQSIISNNNSNTQNIINNQNQNSDREYNFISNSTIDSNTTSNVNNIDVSNSDTKLAVTNFALIPLNFMQSIINSFSSSCSQVCIGNCGSGHDNDWRFIFPCLDFENILGSTLYSVIDSLFAFGMVFAFIRSVRKFFINALLLTTDASSEVGVFL